MIHLAAQIFSAPVKGQVQQLQTSVGEVLNMHYR
jgi:multidrug resistance efflux pump